MNNFLRKTFCGLNLHYYLRQLFFGVVISAITISLSFQHGLGIGKLIFYIINAFLYPYARFVYEKVIEFIFGKQSFIADIKWMFIIWLIKILTMFLCWFFSIFIAPIGLIFLYFYHTKNEQKS